MKVSLALVLVLATASSAAAKGRSRAAVIPDEAEIEMEPVEATPEEVPLPAEVVLAAPTAPRARPWYRRGMIYVRAGVLHVSPRARSGEMVLSGVGGPASLAVENGPIAGSRAEMGKATSAAMIIGIARPLGGGEVALETVLAPPVTFELRAGGTVADESLAPTVLGTVPTGIPPLGPLLGRTKALPPVVTVVYRAFRGARVRPYLGVGVSYLHTYDRQITNPIMTEVAQPRLLIGDAVSAVGQLGLDVHVAGRIYATADVKAMSGFATTARVENIHMKTPAFPLYESVYVGDVSVEVVVRPVIVTIGAGTTF